MPSILVFGHKNPDNDAISAAIGYAYLKNELAKKNGEDVTYEAVPRAKRRTRLHHHANG